MSNFNGSVSNKAASAQGLVYTWESSVSATGHKDVATPVLTSLHRSRVLLLLLQSSAPGRMSQESQGRLPRDQADCRQVFKMLGLRAASLFPPPPGQVGSHPSTSNSRHCSDCENGDEANLLQLWLFLLVSTLQKGYETPIGYSRHVHQSAWEYNYITELLLSTVWMLCIHQAHSPWHFA